MSTAQLVSLVGVLFALLVALVGVIFNELRGRIKVLEARDNQAVLLTRIDASTLEIAKLEARFDQRTKDKDEFDYKFRHGQYVNDITAINTLLWPLATKMEVVEKDIEGLRDWKHLVVDPYVPGTINEHDRRLNRLDAKVFNGHRES